MSLVIHFVGKSSIVLLAIKSFGIFMPTSSSHKVLQISKVLLSQLWMSTDIVLIYPFRFFPQIRHWVTSSYLVFFWSLLTFCSLGTTPTAEVHSGTSAAGTSLVRLTWLEFRPTAETHSGTSAAGTSLVRLTWLEFRPTAETHSGTSLGCLNKRISFCVINPYYTEVVMWNCLSVKCSQPRLF